MKWSCNLKLKFSIWDSKTTTALVGLRSDWKFDKILQRFMFYFSFGRNTFPSFVLLLYKHFFSRYIWDLSRIYINLYHTSLVILIFNEPNLWKCTICVLCISASSHCCAFFLYIIHRYYITFLYSHMVVIISSPNLNQKIYHTILLPCYFSLYWCTMLI